MVESFKLMFPKSIYFYFLVVSFFISSNLSASVINRTITTIGVGNTPSDIAITPNGRFAYVVNNNNDSLVNGNTVSVIILKR